MSEARGRECVLGLDIGTTGARGVVFDLDGAQRYVATRDYPLLTPRPGWAEQDPAQVYDAAMACLAEAAGWASETGCHVAALGWSSILHSVIPMDGKGSALDASIIWADGRGVGEADAIRREIDPLALYRRTGGPVHPMYLPPKIRWFRSQRPDVFRATRTWAGIKEYVLWRWAGLRLCDRSNASGTGLFGLDAGTWDAEALAVAGIDETLLPPLVEPTQALDVPAEALRAVGLPADCVVVAGGGDGVLQTIGTGCTRPGPMVAMVATSGAVRSVVQRPLTDAHGRTWCYYLADGRWVAGAAINNAGIVYAWLRDQLAGAARDVGGRLAGGADSGAVSGAVGQSQQAAASPAAPDGELSFDDLERWAASVPAGADGLVFLPYLAGERAPNWNANARGLLFGLSLAHNYRHLARATLEGVAYRMRTIYEPMVDVAGPPQEIRAAGGFIKSALWMQIVADVLGQPLTLVDSPEASALGAAMLAMRGAGIVQRFEDLEALVSTGDTIMPVSATHARYARLYDLYQQLYSRVGDAFATVATLQAELAAET